MSATRSRRGCTVSTVVMEKKDDVSHTVDGVPILEQHELDDGTKVEIVPKNVRYEATLCPECDVPLKYDEDEEPVCPDCGYMREEYLEHEHKDYFGGYNV